MSTRPESYRIEPYELARKRDSWRGSVPIRCFTRLKQFIQGSAGVEIDLNFALDEEQRAVVAGSAASRARLSCQRCLEQVEVELKAKLSMRLVRNELEARRQHEGDDIIIIEDDRVSVVELVEDDLLMSLPGQICPELEDCINAPALQYPSAVSSAGAEPGRANPFQVLKKLMHSGDD